MDSKSLPVIQSQNSPLSVQIQRGLSDKLYEKRKQAALEIEKLVRDHVGTKEFEKITVILQSLITDFAYSVVPNSRNGGLIALAACAIALGTHVNSYLEIIVPPILACFNDHDSRVRYYACESMYNVSKVARSQILYYFNEIFDALSKLSVDVEISVKNGAELLDRLMKDIVTEKSTWFPPQVQESTPDEHPLSSSPTPGIYPPVPGTTSLRPNMSATMFNLPRFIPLLNERLKILSTPGRIFLVQWIFVLNSVPDLELIAYLPEFLDMLFVYLCDQNLDVRTATLNVLEEFLREMRNILQKDKKFDLKDEYTYGQSVVLDFGKMAPILIKHVQSKDEETQVNALKWMQEFYALAGRQMLPFTSRTLSSLLPVLSQQEKVRILAGETNQKLYNLVLEASTADPSLFDAQSTITVLMTLFFDEHEDTRIGCLDWLIMLHRNYPQQVNHEDNHLRQGLLKTLSDYSEEVIRRALVLLAQLSDSSDDGEFKDFMNSLLELFLNDRRLLETRGSLIVRQLGSSLNPERMYLAFAEILESSEDLDFAGIMVQNLNMILITAPEFHELRKRIKNLEAKEGLHMFSSLYRCWCHNPVSLFSLCLLAQQYEHALTLLSTFGEMEITVQHLVQIDKLVQLLESPVFTSLRLQLLEPDKHPALYKCLYGLLMLLPQSSAFATLRNRLNAVSSLLLFQPQQPRKSSVQSIRWHEFLNHFKAVQQMHDQKERPTRSLSRKKDKKKK
ncbi:vacuolar protein 14 C-terminal Fig4p binding-domain-containing protein [Gorgonomyces haynaldii]|nr:vacuolar protein 14 C-terminal Fig4p binding-domain-containing protein [Gorgonomyces haynaldii]